MVSPETTINNGTNRQGQSKRSRPKKPIHTPNLSNQRILLLHGNRQSGQLFLGRLDRLRKRILKELHLDFVAPEAPFPHPEDPHLRTWWNRHDDVYNGLDESLDLLHREFIQDENEIVGILGFSQGARLAHLVALLHTENPEKWFPGLRFVIMVAGYDAPLPDGFRLSSTAQQISIPSLHVWGLADPLILPDQAQAVTKFYEEPEICIHDGKHYVPSKGPQIQSFVDFISLHVREITLNSAEVKKDEKSQFPFGDTELVSTTEIQSLYMQVPDEESALMQQEEVQALEAIFPDEINFKSSKKEVDYEEVFDHPIIYDMKLLPSSAEDDIKKKNWPTRPLLLRVEYPYNYPLEEIPKFQLIHNNNIYEFPSLRVATVMNILKETATMELGMPSILSCVYAAKDYLDSPVCDNETHTIPPRDEGQAKENNEDIDETLTSIIKRSPPEEIIKCTLEGLDIAESLLRSSALNNPANTGSNTSSRQGGSFWTYTIGLVGKPSAGKSTFFNAATAFSRQRGDVEGDSEWGGASMAAHPFTTIDPNIGYCLIPAAPGSCPEDDISGSKNDFGSSHGRDPEGQRFLPVLLKDVAGLVPGAYQGRGRGNKFLNDLCDATVLIHVLDASGTADAQGNTTVTRDDAEFTNPIDDLAWIRNELVEWVYSNLSVKWDTIVRKGRHKLSGMFSGYGQREAVTHNIFSALENFLDEHYQKDRPFDNIGEWNQGDIHRLVSAFLGVRFPMALALNKCDLPSSKKHIKVILEALPIHGAHAGTPLVARNEMSFVRQHLSKTKANGETAVPTGCWRCLTSAMMLQEPLLVFPVSDMSTYAPLPGLNKEAVGHPSLPSKGMIRCIKAAGGVPPTCWDDEHGIYNLPNSKKKMTQVKLRDAIMMKPGSTVEEVFLTLKNLGALSGDFVRAEACGTIGENPKPVPKNAVIGKKTRIIKIMSTKRTTWQS